MTNPTEKTTKPSDSILNRVNATREPNQRTLTLAGGWEPGDTQSVVIAMLRDLDEQRAAQSAPVLKFASSILHGSEQHREWLLRAASNFVQGLAVDGPPLENNAPPRLTEKPYFEGLAEHQKRSRESVQWSRQFLSTVGDSNLCAHCGNAYLEHRYVTSGGVSISYCPVVAPIAEPLVNPLPKRQAPLVMIGPDRTVEAEPPVPEEGERERAGSDPLGICEPEQCHKYQVGLIEQRDAQISVNKELVRERDEALARVEQLKGERDAALAKVEELKAQRLRLQGTLCAAQDAEERATAQLEAVRGHVNAANLERNAATSRAEAAEALLAEIRAVLVSRCWDAGSVKNEQLPGVVVSLLQSQSHLRTVSSAASERAEAAEGRIEALGEALESAHASRNALIQSGDESYHRAEAAEGRVKELERERSHLLEGARIALLSEIEAHAKSNDARNEDWACLVKDAFDHVCAKYGAKPNE